MLTEIFSYDFMQRAIMAVVAISILLRFWNFPNLRHQSLMSDTLATFLWLVLLLVFYLENQQPGQRSLW